MCSVLACSRFKFIGKARLLKKCNRQKHFRRANTRKPTKELKKGPSFVFGGRKKQSRRSERNLSSTQSNSPLLGSGRAGLLRALWRVVDEGSRLSRSARPCRARSCCLRACGPHARQVGRTRWHARPSTALLHGWRQGRTAGLDSCSSCHWGCRACSAGHGARQGRRWRDRGRQAQGAAWQWGVGV